MKDYLVFLVHVCRKHRGPDTRVAIPCEEHKLCEATLCHNIATMAILVRDCEREKK